MKNLFNTFLMFALVTVVFTSCTNEELTEDYQNIEQATEPSDSTHIGSPQEPDPEDDEDIIEEN